MRRRTQRHALILGVILNGIVSQMMMISAMDLFRRPSLPQIQPSPDIREGTTGTQGQSATESTMPSWEQSSITTIEEVPKTKTSVIPTQKMSTWVSELRISTNFLANKSKSKIAEVGR